MTEKTIKKAAAFLSAFAVVAAMAAAGNFSDKKTNVYAFSREDKITAIDVIKIKQSMLGFVCFNADEYERYDVNNDGVINFRDFSAARKLFLEDNDISVLLAAVSSDVSDQQIMPPATVITDDYVVTAVPETTVPAETPAATEAITTTEATTATTVTTTEATTTTTVTTTEATTTTTVATTEATTTTTVTTTEATTTTTVTTTEATTTAPVTTTEVTTTTEMPVTTPAATESPSSSRPSSRRIEVNSLLQNPELPTGCEVTALTMLLNHYGFSVSKTQLADIMPKFNFYYINNVLYGADFMDTFPGNPRSTSGYGCYTPCMVKTAEMYFNMMGNEDYYLDDLTGTEFDTLLSYVAAGKPVMVWATMGMIEPYYTTSWITPDGRQVRWHANEHCLLLTGYDKNTGTVYVNDPLKGKTAYNMSVFKLRYDQMGRFSAFLRKNGESVELLKPETPTSPVTHSVGDEVTYTGTVYYSSFGGTSAEVSGTYTITEIIDDESRPYRIRLGTAGWVPYDFDS